MKAVAMVVVAVSMLATSGHQGTERTVVVPEDTTPFTVEMQDSVRLIVKGISGSTVETTVEGPAKVTAVDNISYRAKGGISIGGLEKQIELKPSGKGNVKATINVKPPQPDSKVTTTIYEFKVQ